MVWRISLEKIERSDNLSDGGNGNALSEGTFFQSTDGLPPYEGIERRVDRAYIPEPLKLILDEVRKIGRSQARCGDGCLFSPDDRAHMPHAIEAAKEIAKEAGKDATIKDGAYVVRDQSKEVGQMLTTRSKLINGALLIMVGIIIRELAKRWGV